MLILDPSLANPAKAVGDMCRAGGLACQLMSVSVAFRRGVPLHMSHRCGKRHRPSNRLIFPTSVFPSIYYSKRRIRSTPYAHICVIQRWVV